MLRLRKRQTVRIISFAAAVLVLISAACVSGFLIASRYRSTIEHGYQMALSELSDYMTSIRSALEKGLYSNTNTSRLSLAAKLSSDCTGAKSALERLPVSADEAQQLQKFLSQTGDFSAGMINSAARGYEFSAQSRSSLEALSEYADRVAPIVEDLSARYGDGESALGVDESIDGGASVNARREFVLDADFSEINESFSSYPTLIYDGPFADSTLNRESIYLEGAAECEQSDARARAAEFLSVGEESLKPLEPIEGRLPAYAFSFGESGYITVTRRGCRVLEMSESHGDIAARLEYSSALERAADFLEKQGYKNMRESYYAINNNVCVINFAYVQDEVICYPDLIKVGVSLEDGRILSYSAENYLMNHCVRRVQPYLSPASARLSLSPYLTAGEPRLAVVPTEGGYEYLCYEFVCKGVDDEDILVYINCETGLEEQILILLKSENGELTV